MPNSITFWPKDLRSMLSHAGEAKGSIATEYALLAGCIALVAVVAIQQLGFALLSLPLVSLIEAFNLALSSP